MSDHMVCPECAVVFEYDLKHRRGRPIRCPLCGLPQEDMVSHKGSPMVLVRCEACDGDGWTSKGGDEP